MELSVPAKEDIRAKLLRKHRRLIGNQMSPDQLDRSDYSATGDEVDLACRTAEFYVQEGTLMALARSLGGIGRALEKLDEETWGICDKCGHDIPEECMKQNPGMSTHFRSDWNGVDRSVFDPCARACSDYGQPNFPVLKAMRTLGGVVAVPNGQTVRRRSAVVR